MEWLIEELANLKRDIRGETKSLPSTEGKQKLLRRRRQDEEYPLPSTQRGRKEEKNNSVKEVRWSTVVARGKSNKTEQQLQQQQQQQQKQRQQQKPAVVGKKVTPSKPRSRKVPQTAAVVLTCPPGHYEETMREAKNKIDLKQCGVEKGPGIKTALTGALTFEFSGPEGHVHADRVAQKLRELFNNRDGIRVTRPMKMAELRVRDLEDSIKSDEIKY